ncbi:hypothetical protein TNCV_3125201 [Trichonephila clavipes]|nr:hypothetical protein TNCV_3125201 [Trichonephila clavipes]
MHWRSLRLLYPSGYDNDLVAGLSRDFVKYMAQMINPFRTIDMGRKSGGSYICSYLESSRTYRSLSSASVKPSR